jgi:MFS family permease
LSLSFSDLEYTDREIVDDASQTRLCGSPNSKAKMLHLVTAGFFLYTLGFVCVGAPLPADELRERLQWMLYCGLVLIGAGSTLTMLPILPLLQQYQCDNMSEELNDRLTSYWNGSFNLGAFLGPIIWSAINESKGFSTTYLSIAAITAAFGVIYMIIGAQRATRM